MPASLFSWILAMFFSLTSAETIARHSGEPVDAVNARLTEAAHQLDEVVMTEPPLPGWRRRGTAALVAAVAWHEGGFLASVDQGARRGDGGRSWCWMQIHIGQGKVPVGDAEVRGWTGPDLIADRKKCFRAGLAVLRSSVAYCAHEGFFGPSSLTGYTTGKCREADVSAAGISAIAHRLLRVRPGPVVASPGGQSSQGS